jgi:hypothetical protein
MRWRNAERRTLDRWGKGDPDGYLEISAAATLTFQFVRQGSEGAKPWNCTEVYRNEGGESFTHAM